MVTDRISTACLLVILSQVYREDFVTPGLVFVSLPVLDIGSQWLQMYRKVLLSLGKMPTTLYLCCSTFLTGKTRHKDAKDSTNWLFKAYYGNRMFMGYCCVACEVIVAFRVIIHIRICKCYRYFLPDPTVSTLQLLYLILFLIAAVQQGSPLSFLVALSLFAWAQSSKRLMSDRLVTTNNRKDIHNSVIEALYGIRRPNLYGKLLRQLVNCPSKMKTAADMCVPYDIEKKQKP
ncbi:putative CDP-diacylglycerol--inositol 3-phosphatidyltransferase 2 [Citrus sinensis]|nr:putative CDP-diacylglycerol--inositol 3-phosphatidyltransferase 2 [Citrus sinensis]